MTKYTAAIVGLGRIGYSLGFDKKREQPASHTMALKDNPRIEIIAGCDTDKIALEKWKEGNKGAKTFSNSEDMFKNCSPDIVVVSVPESEHYKEAIIALRNLPRLLILEKPVALSLEEAKKIQEEAKKQNVPVMINHERRFAEDFKKAKAYIEKIGRLQSIKSDLYSSLCVYNPKEENTGSYSLIHDGTHLADATLFFLEEVEKPSTITKITSSKTEEHLKTSQTLTEEKKMDIAHLLHSPCITGIFRDEKKNVRQFSAHYTTEKCPDVTISMSGRSHFFSFEITITGTEGRVCIGNGYLKFYQRKESPFYTGFYSLLSDKSETKLKKTRYFSNMIQNAIDFLDGKSPLKSTIQTGINALAILEEIKVKIR